MTLVSHHRFMTELIRRSSTNRRTGTPLLERGLIDEVDLHVLPRLLGDGTRLYDVADGSMGKLEHLGRR